MKSVSGCEAIEEWGGTAAGTVAEMPTLLRDATGAQGAVAARRRETLGE
ncbi:hypothetical protein [Streptomyces sp. NPDC001843]